MRLFLTFLFIFLGLGLTAFFFVTGLENMNFEDPSQIRKHNSSSNSLTNSEIENAFLEFEISFENAPRNLIDFVVTIDQREVNVLNITRSNISETFVLRVENPLNIKKEIQIEVLGYIVRTPEKDIEHDFEKKMVLNLENDFVLNLMPSKEFFETLSFPLTEKMEIEHNLPSNWQLVELRFDNQENHVVSNENQKNIINFVFEEEKSTNAFQVLVLEKNTGIEKEINITPFAVGVQKLEAFEMLSFSFSRAIEHYLGVFQKNVFDIDIVNRGVDLENATIHYSFEKDGVKNHYTRRPFYISDNRISFVIDDLHPFSREEKKVMIEKIVLDNGKTFNIGSELIYSLTDAFQTPEFKVPKERMFTFEEEIIFLDLGRTMRNIEIKELTYIITKGNNPPETKTIPASSITKISNRKFLFEDETIESFSGAEKELSFELLSLSYTVDDSEKILLNLEQTNPLIFSINSHPFETIIDLYFEKSSNYFNKALFLSEKLYAETSTFNIIDDFEINNIAINYKLNGESRLKNINKNNFILLEDSNHYTLLLDVKAVFEEEIKSVSFFSNEFNSDEIKLEKITITLSDGENNLIKKAFFEEENFFLENSLSCFSINYDESLIDFLNVETMEGTSPNFLLEELYEIMEYTDFMLSFVEYNGKVNLDNLLTRATLTFDFGESFQTEWSVVFAMETNPIGNEIPIYNKFSFKEELVLERDDFFKKDGNGILLGRFVNAEYKIEFQYGSETIEKTFNLIIDMRLPHQITPEDSNQGIELE